MKTPWSVIVVYEDAATREEAVKFCDGLVEQFWKQNELELSWWSFDLLQHAPYARQAAQQAIEASLIIFAVRPEGEMPEHLRAWIETWVGQRTEFEGALIGLMDAVAGLNSVQPDKPDKHVLLRNVAHRGGMDYLTHVPPNFLHSIPESIDSYSTRAGQVTSVLDEILRHPLPAPHQ